MTPIGNNFERGARVQRCPGQAGSAFVRALKLCGVVCLPFLLSGCNQSSIESSERDALLRKSAEVNRSYVAFFRGARTDELSRRRMRTIIALISKIGDNKATGITEQLMELAFEDTIGEAKRIYKPVDKERCELVHLAGTYYTHHLQFEKAEKYYRDHIADLVMGHKEPHLEDMALDPQTAVALIEDLELLAPVLDSLGKSAEGAECRQKALLIRTKNVRKDVSATEHIQMANSYAAKKQFESARIEFKNALAGHSDAVTTYSATLGLARLELSACNYAAALRYYKLAISQLASIPQAAGDYPGVSLEFARINRLAGRLDESLDNEKKVIAFFETKNIPHNDVYNSALSETAEIFILKKRFDLALPMIEKCVADAQRNPAIARDFAWTALRMAGDVYASQGKDAQARSYYERSVAMAKSSSNSNLRFLALNCYGQYLERKDIKLAVKILEESISELEKTGSPEGQGFRGPYLRTAVAETALGHYDRAHAYLAKAHQSALKYAKTFGKTDTANGVREYRAANAMMRLILSRIAEVYCYQGKFKKSEEYFRQAAAVGPGPDDLQDRIHMNEFWALKNWCTGDAARERQLFDQARRDRSDAKVNERQRLFLSIKKLVDIYGKPNHPPVEITLNAANQALEQMRSVLGPDDLYYVTETRHLSEKFDSAGFKNESEALIQCADQQKNAALKNTPHEP